MYSRPADGARRSREDSLAALALRYSLRCRPFAIGDGIGEVLKTKKDSFFWRENFGSLGWERESIAVEIDPTAWPCRKSRLGASVTLTPLSLHASRSKYQHTQLANMSFRRNPP